MSTLSQGALATRCHYHPNCNITNFCKDTLMPLCPQCIPTHIQQNGKTEVVTIEQAHQEQTQKIAANLQVVKNHLNTIQQLKGSHGDAYTYHRNEINKAKIKAIKVVEQFFHGIEQELQGIQLSDINLHEVGQIEQQLVQKQNDLNQLHNKLHQQDKVLKHLIKLHGTNHLDETEEDIKQCSDNLDQVSSKKVDVSIDDSKLYNLNLELAKYVTIKNAQFFRSQINQNQELSGNKSQVQQSNISPYFQKSDKKDHPIFQQTNSQQLGQALTSKVPISTITHKALTLNSVDYYDPTNQNKLLVYTSGNTVFTLQIDTKQWISFTINETLPMNARVLVTPIGDIFLTGGILSGAVCNQFKKIDLHSKQSIDLPTRMITARQNHAIIYFSNQIFVFGGVNQSGADISQCERFDLQTFKPWISTKPLILPTSHFNVAQFRNKFIVKSSHNNAGLLQIELYDPKLDEWRQIELNNKIPYNSLKLSGILQINNLEIAIFGGNVGKTVIVKLEGSQFQSVTAKSDEINEDLGQFDVIQSLMDENRIVGICADRQIKLFTYDTYGWKVI